MNEKVNKFLLVGDKFIKMYGWNAFTTARIYL